MGGVRGGQEGCKVSGTGGKTDLTLTITFSLAYSKCPQVNSYKVTVND